MEGNFFKIDKPDYNRKYVLIVEGKDDAILIDIILQEIGASPSDVVVIVAGGKGAFGKHLSLLSKSAAFQKKVEAILIFRDADDLPDKALEETHRDLRRIGLPTPAVAEIEHSGGKSVGIYLFPRPGASGDLEVLALMIAERSDTLIEATEFISAAIKRDVTLGKEAKRKVQAFLAGASAEIRPTVGWAFKDGTIPVSSALLPELSNFIRKAIGAE